MIGTYRCGMRHQFIELLPVADEIAPGIIVPPIEHTHAWSVEMRRDRWPTSEVCNPMDTLLVGPHRGGAILRSPDALPRLPQPCSTGLVPIVEPCVALLQQRANHTVVCAP